MTAVIRVDDTYTLRLDYYADDGPRWSSDQPPELAARTVGLLKIMAREAQKDGIVKEGPAYPHPEAVLANYVVSQIPGAVLVSVDDPPGWPFVEGRVY